MATNQKRYTTQWAAQFYTAAELTRRGYLVSFTFSNAPMTDLLVATPSQNHFMVDVKGLSSRNFWLIREREARDDLYYVLVYLPPALKPPVFYVIGSYELMKAIRRLRERTEQAGEKWVESGAGINWTTACEYEDKWDVLPPIA